VDRFGTGGMIGFQEYFTLPAVLANVWCDAALLGLD